jgi:hypothetical protein
MTSNNQNSKIILSVAPYYKRLGAFLFQLLLSLIPIFLIAYLLGYNFSDFIENIALFALGLIFIGVCSSGLGVILYPVYQGNIGHKLFNLKVVDADTGLSIHSPSHGALRGFLKVCLVPLLIPILIIFINKKRQTLWDKMSNTRVVCKKNP